MRVVAGCYKGRKLHTPKDSYTRPTQGKVKEAVFSSIAQVVAGSIWLDLFAGSGAMGIEALSRGAKYCTFADSSKESCGAIKKNLLNLGIGPDKAKLICIDVLKFVDLGNCQPVDIIYMDPPYNEETLYAQTIFRSQGILKPGGLLIVEHRRNWQLDATYVKHIKTKEYGIASVSYYRKTGWSDGKGDLSR